MRSRVMQHHPGENASRGGVENWCLFTQKVRKCDDAASSWFNGLRFAVQFLRRHTAGQRVREPLDQRTTGSHAAVDQRQAGNIVVVEVEMWIGIGTSITIQNIASPAKFQQNIAALR